MIIIPKRFNFSQTQNKKVLFCVWEKWEKNKKLYFEFILNFLNAALTARERKLKVRKCEGTNPG